MPQLPGSLSGRNIPLVVQASAGGIVPSSVLPRATEFNDGVMTTKQAVKLGTVPNTGAFDMSGTLQEMDGVARSIGNSYTPTKDGIYIIEYIGEVTEDNGTECASWEGPLFSTWHRANGVVSQLGAAPSTAPTKHNGGDAAAWKLQCVFGGPNNRFSFTADGNNVNFGLNWRLVASVIFMTG